MNNIRIGTSVFTGASSASAFAEAAERERRAAEALSRIAAEKDAQLKAGIDAIIEQRDLTQQQVDILHEQNALLADNYEKLKDLYDDQVQANIDAKAELAKTKRYNGWMMVVSVIAMLAAIASPFIHLFFTFKAVPIIL